MIAGHLQEKKNLFYIVLNCKDEHGKRKPKWIPTGLKVKGNKKKAEIMLQEARKNHYLEEQAQAIEAEKKAVIATTAAPSDVNKRLFADFMLQWLEMMKNSIELITYISYSNAVKGRIEPYFREKGIMLEDLTTEDIQNYYTHEMNVRGVSANTVIHYHANIRKALQYAVKIKLIVANPANLVERPKKNNYVASFYNVEEMNQLLAAILGEKIELAIILAAFYGLRRSEVVGLKWSAIDLMNRTITIKHTVTSGTLDGKFIEIEKDRTKNKASRRTLPLVDKFYEILMCMKEQQEAYRSSYGNTYCTDYLDYIYLDALGQRIKPGYITQHFPILLKRYRFRRIRYHDLRHSCASLLLSNGVSMKEVQEWLGHSDYATTANIYSHLEYNSKVSSAQIMSDVLKIK
ncbi:tyrosine-type recombinase/integrase [Paenibacillus massiliensis]|uniref:tyrosine-type recombinase/integrase n=1 Tax=Paenibacillus massiliensis TaxID=225917 RepID=UPI00037B7B11|nr:site-specific integrase [Paenibacillus massiliensis]